MDSHHSVPAGRVIARETAVTPSRFRNGVTGRWSGRPGGAGDGLRPAPARLVLSVMHRDVSVVHVQTDGVQFGYETRRRAATDQEVEEASRIRSAHGVDDAGG